MQKNIIAALFAAFVIACDVADVETIEPSTAEDEVLSGSIYYPTSDIYISGSKIYLAGGSGSNAYTRLDAATAGCPDTTDGYIVIGKVIGTFPPTSPNDSVSPSDGFVDENISLLGMPIGTPLREFQITTCSARDSGSASFRVECSWNGGNPVAQTIAPNTTFGEVTPLIVPINALHQASDTLHCRVVGMNTGVPLVNRFYGRPYTWDAPPMPMNPQALIKNAGAGQDVMATWTHSGYETAASNSFVVEFTDATNSTGWTSVAGSPINKVVGQSNYSLIIPNGPTVEATIRHYRVRANGPSLSSAWVAFDLTPLSPPLNAYQTMCQDFAGNGHRGVGFTDFSNQETGFNLYIAGNLAQSCAPNPSTGTVCCGCGSVDCPTGGAEIRAARNTFGAEESASASCQLQ